MDNTICYLNTDLDLTSAEDLTALAAAFEAGGVPPLHLTPGADGLWFATFETNTQFAEPEPNIAAMLDMVESLPRPLRSVWDGCTQREFNIGYDCGVEPWAFNQGLPAELLGRMAAAGASLRVTLYPDQESATPAQGPTGADASWPQALDAVLAAPEHHTLLFENATVRVLDTRIPPGGQTPVHTHRWPSVLYVTSWSPFVRRNADGQIVLDSRSVPALSTPPTVLSSPPLAAHSLENVGEVDLRVISVELKQGAS